MHFVKMHGTGNDFIVVDVTANHIDDPAALARRLCRRRFNIGADGLILICESPRADYTMRIFNADGSEPQMCGNGVRCAAKFLYDSGLCRKPEISIDTLAGVKHVQLAIESGAAIAATVDMGTPEFAPENIPVAAASNRIVLNIEGRQLNFFCVSMGNPHAVTFDLYPDEAEFLRLGALLEVHPIFPERANIEFCRILSPSCTEVKVWERGSGPTLACGTGSCAVLAAGVQLGLLERSAEIRLPGGPLQDAWHENGHIFMTGPAETVCRGEF